MLNIKPRSGFTLIELLTVMAIIGILATMVTVNTLKARVKTRVNAAKIDVSSMLVSFENYKASHLALNTAVTNKNITNSGLGWKDSVSGLSDTGFWNTIDSNITYTPPLGSEITYRVIIGNSGTGVFCAIGQDIAKVISGKDAIIGKSGNVYEGMNVDCAIN